MGKIVGIASRPKKKAPMEIYERSRVSFSNGIADDSRGLIKGDRQVTVMTKEGWEAACEELGVQLHWSTRRANLLIEGVDLEDTTGYLLKIGDFFLEITGELTPCQRMDEEFPGLKQALTPNWRGGVCCKILSEGFVVENDSVVLGLRE